MPTSITAPIVEGKDITASEFISRCAWSIDFLMDVNHNSLSDSLPDKIDPDVSYYQNKIVQLESDLEAIHNKTNEELLQEIKDDNAEEEKRYQSRLHEKREIKKRLNRIYPQVKDWEPPTEAHIPLKNYAMYQLEKAYEYDTREDYISVPNPYPLDVDLYRKETVDMIESRIQMYKEDIQDKIKSAATSTQWVQELKSSLKELEEGSVK